MRLIYKTTISAIQRERKVLLMEKNFTEINSLRNLIPKITEKLIETDSQIIKYRLLEQNPNVKALNISTNSDKTFNIVFGEHINGGFCGVLNKNKSCELSHYSDKFFNTERFSQIIRGKENVKLLVNTIADYEKTDFTELQYTKEISVDFNGFNYLIILGVNGFRNTDFCVIPNWEISFETNIGSIEEKKENLIKLFKNKRTAKALAAIIFKELR